MQLCSKDQDSPSHQLIWQYMRVMKLHRIILERQLNKTGVYRSQHQILLYIAKNPNVSQKEIAKLHGVSTATIAVSLKKLEKGGYIRRIVDQEDNRFNQICITDKGSDVAEHSRIFFRQVEDQMFSGISEQEIRYMGKIFDRIYENMSIFLPEAEREEIK